MTALAENEWATLAHDINVILAATDMPLTGVYIPPDSADEGRYDGQIEFRNTDGSLCGLILQVGIYGGALFENDYRGGEVLNVRLLETFSVISAWEVYPAIGAWWDQHCILSAQT